MEIGSFPGLRHPPVCLLGVLGFVFKAWIHEGVLCEAGMFPEGQPFWLHRTLGQAGGPQPAAWGGGRVGSANPCLPPVALSSCPDARALLGILINSVGQRHSRQGPMFNVFCHPDKTCILTAAFNSAAPLKRKARPSRHLWQDRGEGVLVSLQPHHVGGCWLDAQGADPAGCSAGKRFLTWPWRREENPGWQWLWDWRAGPENAFLLSSVPHGSAPAEFAV